MSRVVIVCHLLFSLYAAVQVQCQSSAPAPSSQRYVPPELQVNNHDIKTLLDSADKLARAGSFSESLPLLQKALEIAAKQKSLADKAIVEDKFAVYYFTQGKLDEAKLRWLSSLSDGIASSNLVLQADVLVALSALQQTSGHLDEALKAVKQALDLARKSKSLYIQSRVLGELSRLQLLSGKTADARASIEEALDIDRANRYDWEAGHLLGLAWLNTAESKTDKAIEFATSARNLAVKNEDYLIFIQASLFTGQAYVHTGKADEGISILEEAQKGLSSDHRPLFQSQDAYVTFASLPYLRVTFLESLGMAYEAADRIDDALKNWQDLYDTTTKAGFTLARGESARHLADLYKRQNEFTKSIDNYELAASAFTAAGNEQSSIEALSLEARLLFQRGEKDRALRVNEGLLPQIRSSKNVAAQFVTSLAIAELLDGSERLDRVETALVEAQSLVGPDLTVPGVKPDLIVELFFRLADFYEKHKDIMQELIALEKAVTPALALSSAIGPTKNGKPLQVLIPKLQAVMNKSQVPQEAEANYANAKFGDALILYEVLQYFDEIDAAWKGQYEEYRKNLSGDPKYVRLLQIPQKLVLQDEGAAVLALNMESMGPLAEKIRPGSLYLLATYYTLHPNPDLVVKFAGQALQGITTAASDTPNEWDVVMACELANALVLTKDARSALEPLGSCMSGATKLAIPGLLEVAHQTNVTVLDAAGKHDQAQESVQFLLKQTPDDPMRYVMLAQMRATQGDWPGAAEAWRSALNLFEKRKEVNGAAEAHLALADLPNMAVDSEQRRAHLEAADDICRGLGSSEGQVRAQAGLGTYYAARKDEANSRKYFDRALQIARQANRTNLEALVLGQIGRAYEGSSDLSHAVEYYRKAADVYGHINDPVNEALQLENMAKALDVALKPDEALKAIMKARNVADKTNSWPTRYWVRRVMADVYGGLGQFQDGVNVLREAKQISDDVNQTLNSAWAALLLAADLETIGNWEEASQEINYAVPILQQFKDTDDESLAYQELMAIYGARESDLQDLSKALEFYKKARELIETTHPERVALLDLDLTEIYWQQNRFKDAIAKASDALEYYKKGKNELGQASALISLAEAQRSDGNTKAAERTLVVAQPIVEHVKNFYTIGRFYYGLAGLYRAQGKLTDAIQQYEKVIQMLEQFKSGSNTESSRDVAEHYDFIYDELIDAYHALGQSDKQKTAWAADKALEYTELNKSRTFSNSWGHSFLDGLRHQVPMSLQERETAITSERTALQADLQRAMMEAGTRSVQQVKDKLAKLDSAESDLAARLRQVAPAYAEVRYPERMDTKRVPLHLGELLVELKVLHEGTLVWLLTGTAEGTVIAAFYKVDRPKQWFADRVFRIRDSFNGGHPEQFDSKITDELLGALFPESALQRVQAAKAIIFVPDDIFFLFPFEMLSSHGEYLLLRKPTEYFPSSAALRLARTSIRATTNWPESFFGLADPITSSDDPRYQAVTLASDTNSQTVKGTTNDTGPLDRIVSRGFSLERLPGTADEVNGIASLFSSTVPKVEIRMGPDATKQELLRTDLSRYRFVHFATHGILPVESGISEPALVLSYDGKGRDNMLLTLSEILALKLQADMVVLSACNTGSGRVTKAEGVASLGTAFLAAGASSVTVSLWHVADTSTATLMKEFYSNLVQGKTKAESLAAARSVLFSKEYVNHNPYFWASFVLSGD